MDIIIDNLGPFWTVFSYIVTVGIGVVGYRFWKAYLENKVTEEKIGIAVNQQAIDSLMQQVANFSEMYKQQEERILRLEDEIKKQNEKLLEATKAQIRAEAKVEILQTKIRYLEGLLEHYTEAGEQYIVSDHKKIEKDDGSEI